MNLICPKCKKTMENLGNVSGFIFMTNPPKWDNVWACNDCKLKKTIMISQETEKDYEYLNNYEAIDCDIEVEE